MPTSFTQTYDPNSLWSMLERHGAPAPASTGQPDFNLNPSPQSGFGAYGQVPGALNLPNPAGDLSAQYPNLSGTNAQTSADILSKLSGELSPSTLNSLKNAQATFGVGSGMPGSGLSWNALYGNIAGASEAQQQQGIQDYNATIPTVSGTQTVTPGLQSEIASRNATFAAAPNPTLAGQQAQSLFDRYASQSGRAGATAPAGLPATPASALAVTPAAGAPSSPGGGTGSYATAGVSPNLDFSQYGTNLFGLPQGPANLGPITDYNAAIDSFLSNPSGGTGSYNPVNPIGGYDDLSSLSSGDNADYYGDLNSLYTP